MMVKQYLPPPGMWIPEISLLLFYTEGSPAPPPPPPPQVTLFKVTIMEIMQQQTKSVKKKLPLKQFMVQRSIGMHQ